MMKTLLILLVLLVRSCSPALAGTASWYGDENRGRLMANGQRFDPARFICASWEYPLGTRLSVSRADGIPLSVIVTVTDRGPHRRFVRQGRAIDLSRAAFERIEGLEMGLVPVVITRLPDPAAELSVDSIPSLVTK